ncbi:MAG TPA: gfo/Idh/MocA family oxidoreductase, partial [Verrucomicrobiota bacterium]|nr:gfo/Idh/MocA family oxidoreductase [Verrucomicrobiota bacterium]
MNTSLSRRAFLRHSAIATAGLTCWGGLGAGVPGANERIVLAFMGTNGRGSDLARSFAKLPGVETAVVCDVDERAIAKGIQAASREQARAPRSEKDVRRVVENPDVD